MGPIEWLAPDRDSERLGIAWTCGRFGRQAGTQQFNLHVVLGVRFVATEFSTGGKHGGRIDTLRLEEAGNPVIIEYAWGTSESVIETWSVPWRIHPARDIRRFGVRLRPPWPVSRGVCCW